MPLSLRPLAVALVAFTALSCTAGAQSVVFTPVATGLASPVDLQPVPGDATRLVVVQQGGQLRVIENGTLLTAPALTITTRVSSGGERGLLGLAFHPAWPDSAYAYVDYTRAGDGATVIARYTRATAEPLTFDVNSERVLLVVAQPFSNHNAGAIAFAHDGTLLVTLGDGGSGGDPQNHGQRLETLLGSILRIGVDGGGNPPDCGGQTALYTVPADNPFVGSTLNACDEIWTYGMRNPWRLSVDRLTGTPWVGDVGQGSWEEIDTLAAGRNYGWKIMEGFHCYSPSSGCDQTGLTLPVFEYSSSGSNCSITGGYVYRGTRIPGLVGKYLYADYCSGTVWALDTSGATPVSMVLGSRSSPTSFGQDLAGELYVVGAGGVYRIDPNTVAAGAEPDAAALTLAMAGPSPARDRTALRFAADVDGRARLTVHDALGREVARVFDGPMAAGAEQTAVLDVAALAPGVYLARLATAAGARTLRLVVAR